MRAKVIIILGKSENKGELPGSRSESELPGKISSTKNSKLQKFRHWNYDILGTSNPQDRNEIGLQNKHEGGDRITSVCRNQRKRKVRW